MPAVDELKSIDDATRLRGGDAPVLPLQQGLPRAQEHRRACSRPRSTSPYNHAPVNQIALKGVTDSENPTEDTRLYISNENILEAYEAFMTGERARATRSARPRPRRSRSRPRRRARAGWRTRAGWARTWPCSAARRLKTLPFYFPEYRATGSRYTNDSPRIYSIPDERGKKHRAYRISISTGAPGEYYGVQGMTWKDPPLLANPDLVREHNGRKLMLYYDGTQAAPGGLAHAARRLLRVEHAQLQAVEREDACNRVFTAAPELLRARLSLIRRVTRP